jgi:hypothetical protein
MSIDRLSTSSLVAGEQEREGGALAPGREIGSLLAGGAASDLVSQATSLLAREAARLPSIPLGPPNGLSGSTAVPSGSELPGRPPMAGGSDVDPDRLRRQAHEMVETLLALFVPKGESAGDRIPLLRCAVPVAAGGSGCVKLRMANDEATASEVSLYSTNLAADSGYDIPSVRVSVSPQRLTIPPKGEGAFEVKISVPQQTPPGVYSGLIQATGAQYVKAVVSVQVT